MHLPLTICDTCVEHFRPLQLIAWKEHTQSGYKLPVHRDCVEGEVRRGAHPTRSYAIAPEY